MNWNSRRKQIARNIQKVFGRAAEIWCGRSVWRNGFNVRRDHEGAAEVQIQILKPFQKAVKDASKEVTSYCKVLDKEAAKEDSGI